MFGSHKIDSIPQMCTGNGQNKKKYAGGVLLESMAVLLSTSPR